MKIHNVVKTLQELGGSRAKGQGLQTVSFHPFPARMPLCVAEHFIERLTTEESVVLDPMVGSGTSLVAAKRLGRRSIGFDRDPLALLIARTATQSFDSDELEHVRARVLDRADRATRSRSFRLPEVRSQLGQEGQRFIQYWFGPRPQKELFALAESIMEEPEGPHRSLAWVVFSSLIIAKSSGASYALDISRSRPHKDLEKPVVLPFTAWDRRFKAAVARLPFIDDANGPIECRVKQGDARALPLEDGTVDFVLTSPPYKNAIDYLRAHKFSLVWMGHSLEELRELRGTMMGTERGLWSPDGLPYDIEKRLRIRKKKRRRAIARRYLSDLGKVLREIERVLKHGGLAVLAIGPTIISSRRHDAIDVVSKIGESVGLQTVGSITRDLNHSRRSLPFPASGQGIKNSLQRRMRREAMIAFRK